MTISIQHTPRKTLPWPDSVYVLDRRLFNIDDTKPGCDHTNWPFSLSGSMQAEIREKLPTLHQANMMIEVWLGLFAKINHVMSKKKLPQTPDVRIVLYNSTWAALGYTENQCPKALQLLALATTFYKKPLYTFVYLITPRDFYFAK